MGNHVSFKGHSIVSCGILHRELDYLRNTGFLDADKILYTAPGLHANRDELKSQLTRQLENAKKQSENIIVVYGKNCHPDIDKITRGDRISRVEAEDCIDMLTDLEKRKEMSDGKIGSIFWLSPGWLDYTRKNRYVWERIYKDYLGWDNADANVNFGTYRKAIFLDPKPLNVYEEYTPKNILDFSSWTRLAVFRQEITLDRLKGLLSRCILERRNLQKQGTNTGS
jgi:hypothetical protein